VILLIYMDSQLIQDTLNGEFSLFLYLLFLKFLVFPPLIHQILIFKLFVYLFCKCKVVILKDFHTFYIPFLSFFSYRTRYFSEPRKGHNPLQGRAYYQLLECLGVYINYKFLHNIFSVYIL